MNMTPIFQEFNSLPKIKENSILNLKNGRVSFRVDSVNEKEGVLFVSGLYKKDGKNGYLSGALDEVIGKLET
jgi:hypothetical protein